MLPMVKASFGLHQPFKRLSAKVQEREKLKLDKPYQQTET